MAISFGFAAGAAVFLALVYMLLVFESRRAPPAPHESEYFRSDEPAYHPTLTKRAVSAFHRNAPPDSIPDRRRPVLILRLAGLAALAVLFLRHLGLRQGSLAFAVFLFLPPTLPYFSRLDSWMDSVSLMFIAFYFLCGRRTSFVWTFLGGLFCGLAIDAKMTALVTLIPAAVLGWRHEFIRRQFRAVFAGMVAGFAVSHPAWILNPSRITAHVAYWNASNADLQALPLLYPLTELVGSVPFSALCLAMLGLKGIRRSPAIFHAAVLTAAPILFFMVYRTVPAEGLRHLYMVLPFLSVLAAGAFARASIPPRTIFAAVFLSECVFRTFPSF